MYGGATPAVGGSRTTPAVRQSSGRGLLRRLLTTALVVVGLGSLATTNAFAAMAGRPVPSLAGPVLIQPHDVTHTGVWTGGPGSVSSTDTEIRLDADGSARLALWGTVTGSALEPSLKMTVVRGSGRGASFEPAADGIVFRGTLAELPDSSASGLVDPHVWRPGETNTYRIIVSLMIDAPEGDVAAATFSWTASPA